LSLIIAALLVFFTAFNLLEASLPSLISRIAPAEAKGTALGIYSSSQFFGIFVGGVLGGWLQGIWGLAGVFGLCVILAVLWLAVAVTMHPHSERQGMPLQTRLNLDSAQCREGMQQAIHETKRVDFP